MTIDENYIVDIGVAVCGAMKVQIPGQPAGTFFTINFEPGFESQILEDLLTKDAKYPLIAMVMPVPEKSGSGFLEVIFPRIVIAYLAKTNTRTEKVLDKYDSQGVFKTILRPCLREFIKNLAFSVYTSMGDPDLYEYTSRDLPAQQPVGSGLNDYVDIIEIRNLSATIFPQFKTC